MLSLPRWRTFALAVLLPLTLVAAEPDTLPGTTPLTLTGDLSKQMHDAAEHEMDRRIAASAKESASSDSPEQKRERFKKMIGLVDPRVPVQMERFGTEESPALVAETSAYRVFQVRWPVLAGVTGEGLLLEPKTTPLGGVVVLGDADQTPEQLAGLAPGITPHSQFARALAERGFLVLVPTLIDRSTAGSGNPAFVMTNQPHREWLHRQAYMMGRHLIGYEVQKVLACIDWLSARAGEESKHLGVAGYGEGGLLAFYAAAVDPRIQSALVSGYFKPRAQTAEEPLYRNVFGLLRGFGDAEIAALIAPRALVVQYSEEPKVEGPPPVGPNQKNCAAPGKLWTPTFQQVRQEWERISTPTANRTLLAGQDGSPLPFGSAEALSKFQEALAVAKADSTTASEQPKDLRRNFHPTARQLRQVKEIEAHVQHLVQISDHTRNDFFLYQAAPEYRNEKWTYAFFEPKKPEPFIAAAKPYRDRFWKEILGKIEDPLPPPYPRTRKVYERPTWTGYDVVLDTGGEGFTWGVLLLPKDLKPGEKRPVVVCQHGRRGMPADVIEARKEAYHDFAARLAERGFIVLAPHNLYGQEPQYRTISRKGNTVGLSMFSLILRHHQQWLAWLASLPNVDPQRIGFYGLSYGGESAVRIPPLLEGYCLSICSGDFNDWTRKVASTDDPHSFMFSNEWEMPYFNMGSTFSYAELTYLMFPRPFMVERGHHDGVAPDRWVASEFAKTRWLYAQYGLADRTAIEFFNGGHTINGQGTFEFLHQHLNWPKRD